MTTATTPTLVLIDIQKEYVAAGRPFHLAGIGPSLANAGRLLAGAREAGWPIVHVQHLQAGPVFDRDGPHADFIDGFAPLGSERLVIKSKLSAFTNPAFDAALSREGDILVAGYGSTMCCLATVVDAALHGRRLTFVHDASWARAPGPAFTEAETHRHATAILGIHGALATTEQALAANIANAA